jgi:hypothetical protein
LWRFWTEANKQSADHKVNRAVPLLFSLVGVSLLATALVLFLPRWVLGQRLPKDRRVLMFLWYFVCLGAGYILIQVALIQKFVMFLGHPTYALTVIVFSMLVASGLGSYFSKRFVGKVDTRLMRVLAAVAAVVALLAVSIQPLTEIGIGWPRWMRVLTGVCAVAPAAFLMGIPFPSGLSRIAAVHASSVRWAWSLNAAASVMGSAFAILLAIYIGLRATLLIGGALYLVALGVVALTRKSEIPA